MKHFILTSTAFTGSIEYKYCEDGYLISYKYDATMSQKQREFILRKMPLTIHGFQDLIGKSKTLNVEEVQTDMSFDNFWNLYDKKINRKRCMPIWDKLSDADKLKCLNSIAQYIKYLHRTGYRDQKDPDGYLRDRLFETEWNKIY